MANNQIQNLANAVGHMTQYAGKGTISREHYAKIRDAYFRLRGEGPRGEKTSELTLLEGQGLVEELRRDINTGSFHINSTEGGVRRRVVNKALDAILATLEYQESINQKK